MQYLLNNFLTTLKNQNYSKSSLKSYKSDVSQFVKWVESKGGSIEGLEDNLNNYLGTYKKLLKANYKKSTYKRKVSSITTFIEFVEPKSMPMIMRPSKSITYQRNAFLLGAYSIALITLLVTIPQFLNSTQKISEGSPQLPEIKSVSDKYESIKAEGIEVVVSAPQTEDANDNKVLLIDSQEDDSQMGVQYQGNSTLAKNENTTTIYSSAINSSSIIVVTPTINTNGKTLFIDSLGDGWVKVSISETANKDISFNWIIANPVNYREIL